MLELVRNAGPLAYLIILATGLGAPLALATVVLAVSGRALRLSIVLAGVVLGLGASVLVFGAEGRVLGRMATFRAAAHVAPDQRDLLLAQGFEEASANTTLGAMGGGPLVAIGLAGIAAAFARRGAPQ